MYKFFPNSYQKSFIEKRFGSMDNFLKYQQAYKTKFEKFLRKLMNFDEITDYIEKNSEMIPKIDDKSYNFYHHESGLGSDYIYVRNNYHIENLSKEELLMLGSKEELDSSYFINNYKKVIFENGDKVFYGVPIKENLLDSDSIVFEFAYNRVNCENLEQTKKIKEIIDKSFEMINQKLGSNTNFKVSFIVYDALSDIYIDEEKPKFY